MLVNDYYIHALKRKLGPRNLDLTRVARHKTGGGEREGNLRNHTVYAGHSVNSPVQHSIIGYLSFARLKSKHYKDE